MRRFKKIKEFIFNKRKVIYSNNSKKVIFFIIFIFLVISFTNVSFAERLKVGTKAPDFKIKSGDNEILTLDMMKGKVMVLFYETKEVVEKNRKLKDELKKFYAEQPDSVQKSIVKLPIINCSSAFWLFRGIWRNNLRKNSKKEGMIIYGDWKGKMLSDYNLKDNESNVIIIDKKGIIRYSTLGKVGDNEINKIKKLLQIVGNEKLMI